mmetsp:Transcript_107943/g.186162  ORF Transcript_107943/g.186162 Transcript_107943/m.186162 type:complete len:92 (-) Transcript_107943:805-1080(-)
MSAETDPSTPSLISDPLPPPSHFPPITCRIFLTIPPLPSPCYTRSSCVVEPPETDHWCRTTWTELRPSPGQCGVLLPLANARTQHAVPYKR